jgi:neutral amino acid transport system permease protein
VGHRVRARAGATWFPLVLAVLAAFALLNTSTAGAQAEGPAITGRLVQEGKPVPGVEITVRRGRTLVGTTTSDATGTWRVPVGQDGTYQVTLDRKTIPKGFTLADPDRTRLPNVVVQPETDKFVLFPFGEPGPSGPSDFEELLNLTVGGIKFGLIVALAAVGLSLVFGTTGLINFAHGELVTFGALIAWYVNASGGSGPGISLLFAGAVGVVAAGLLGGGLELGLWRPLRHRRTGTIALLVISIGLALFLRHVYLVVFKGNPRSFEQFATQQPWTLGPLSILPKDAAIIVVSVAVLVTLGLLLERTRLGTAVRAVTDDPDLAESSGVDVKRIILIVWIVSTALAGLGGVLLGTTEAVQWDMGLRILLVMFASVILGGLGTAFGAIVGGLVIGVISEVSTFWFPTDYKTAFALLVLILVLLVRPQGILGVRERVA